MADDELRNALAGPRVPLSGAVAPNGQPLYLPEGEPVGDASWYRNNLQPYPVNFPATLEGLLASSGMSAAHAPYAAVRNVREHKGLADFLRSGFWIGDRRFNTAREMEDAWRLMGKEGSEAKADVFRRTFQMIPGGKKD